MSHDIGRMISAHNSTANRIRIGHERSILCFRATPSAGNAMVIHEAPNSVRSLSPLATELGFTRVRSPPATEVGYIRLRLRGVRGSLRILSLQRVPPQPLARPRHKTRPPSAVTFKFQQGHITP